MWFDWCFYVSWSRNLRNLPKILGYKCYLYQNLPGTDSTSIFFVFICNLNCSVREDKARKIISEAMLKSKVFHQLDLSAEFYEQFDCRNESLKNELVYLKLKDW